ncbi:hypothetical protein [Candidatus Sodalis pierantonius]|uniref:hypothetical protein n=1 Tax=Candidatus Sodalis pierantonii TaxID=1486991 RepID=UPI001F23C566|nr:hypothetical protein [Candidatus Sodalis pierantonius]
MPLLQQRGEAPQVNMLFGGVGKYASREELFRVAASIIHQWPEIDAGQLEQ